MSQPKFYPNAAARQAAYRKRQQASRSQEREERGLPPLPSIPQLPGTARWNAALALAGALLESVCQQMSDYYEARTPRWQDSERGEAFLARLEEITQVAEALQALL